MKKYILLLLLLPLFNVNIHSQVQQWVQRFNGLHDSTDVAKAMAIDNQGNVYVTGYSTSLTLFTQIVTIKYSPAGAVLWTRWYGPQIPVSMFSEGNAIALDDSNNVYVAGTSSDLLFLFSKFVVIKYNTLGVQQWVYTYTGSPVPLLGTNMANSIAVDNLHNVYATGTATYGLILGNLDYVTIKLNTSGTQQWVMNYDGPGHSDDIANKLVLDPSNNVIVTGSSRSGADAGTEDYATIKYNNIGVQQWVQRYHGPGIGSDIAHSLAADNSGNIYVTGESVGSGNLPHYATIKYNPAGVQQWVSIYNNGGQDRAYAIVIDNAGNPIVTGGSQRPTSSFDYATVNYNPINGNQQWVQRYNGPGNGSDIAYAITVDNFNNVYVTGSSANGTLNSPTQPSDYLTLKYNSQGIQQWSARYPSPGNGEDRPYAIVIDNTGSVYVTGESMHSTLPGSEDYATVKYGDGNSINGIKSLSGEIPKNFRLYQNYPNPFNPATIVKMDIAAASYVRLSVYNLIGNEVTVLVSEKLNPGSYEVKWDGTKFSSGIYFYKLIINDANNSN